ncbi:soluble NSF attachment protein [Paraphysoderma sedebokerense]|nr:soluble NSF attachment protein [Paraphysoderma sedebokerense]
MIAYIVFIGICVVSFKTNQTTSADSLKDYLKQRQSANSKSRPSATRFLKNLFSRGTPNFTIQDYSFCKVATLDDGSIYVGWLGQWWPLKSSDENDTGSRRRNATNDMEDGLLEKEAEEEIAQARTAKTNRDSHSAGTHFVNAARKYEQSSEHYSQIEALRAYEEAYKAFNHAKSDDKAISALSTACTIGMNQINSGHTTALTSRVAKLHETLAECQTKQGKRDQALGSYQIAKDLYEKGGDGRHFYASLHIASTLCLLGRFQEAVNVYIHLLNYASSDTNLSFKLPDIFLSLCLCYLAAKDWIGLEKQLKVIKNEYPVLDSGREYKFIESLAGAKYNQDNSTFFATIDNFIQIQPLDAWKLEVLQTTKKSAENETVDFR